MAVYDTDLTLISDCYNGPPTVVEMGAPYADGNIGAIDAENFIEGAGCVTQETKNAVDIGASVCVNNTSPISFATDDVLFIWMFFAVGADLYTYANNGHVVIVGSTTAAYDTFVISGSDRTPNPRGGWYNYAVDPVQPPTVAYGGGSTAHQYFGSGVSMINKISKGNPHAIDAIRYGRGEIYCTGADCTFIGMAAENDDNITNQNRWGLFQDVGGSYLWKGLMSFGQAGTAATFSHTGATIAIDDMVHVYSHFNKIEFNHIDTDVTLNNITLSTVSPGNLEMIDDCTVAMTGCTFNTMNTFIFQSGATIISTTFRSCDQVTQGGAIFDSCIFESSTADDTASEGALLIDDLSLVTDCQFTTTGVSGHAVVYRPVGAGPFNVNWDGHIDSGYAATDGSTGYETILIYPDTVGADINLTVINGATTPTIMEHGTYVGSFNLIIRIYDFETTPPDFGTELDGAESHDSATFVFSGSAANLIYIQIMLDGYVEFGQETTVPASNGDFFALLVPETNT